MGIYQSDYWQSSGWGMNRRETQSGTYHPYLPDTLSDFEVRLTPQAAHAVARGESAVRVLNQRVRYLTDTEPLARLILRSEALASSRIEGLQMSAGRILEYEALDELGVSHRVDATEAAAMANIAAMSEAVRQITDDGAVSREALCEINRRLLAGSPAQDEGGVLRTTQNWIGGNNVNPVGAAYVPPRPCYVVDLVNDLLDFCNRSPLPTLAKAAIAHAQLETIHPFADGNGRTGRTLVHVVLRREGLAPHIVPPVSLVLATDKGRYINNLAAFRTDDARTDEAQRAAARQDAISDWVEYFSNACVEACARAEEFEDRIGRIQATWRERGKFRKNSAADILVEKLPGNPVVSVASAARLTQRSLEAARLAINALEDASVLVQKAKNRKSNIYVAREIVDAFTAYERSLATLGGDTAVEKPGRPVPERIPRDRRSWAEG